MSTGFRIRDPLHDLIEFQATGFEREMWRIIDTPQFQRLRKIKQLGFSELVYPGACHTRFSHSIGVFHTARDLAALVEERLGGKFDEGRARVAMAAALVHDLGHGPFSHAFEAALKMIAKRNRTKFTRHELWTSQIINDHEKPGVGRILGGIDEQFRKDVSKLLSSEVPEDIYACIVSSQFDADRLDYLRRDRLMTGVGHGGFDYSWLRANLEVESISLATDGENYSQVDGLILGKKALQAAESYILGLFHMYSAVYFHKATRAAEKMLTLLILRVDELTKDGSSGATGLDANNPLVRFLRDPSLDAYVRLDDYWIWSSMSMMADGRDEILSSLSRRLLDRDLYKAIDIQARFDQHNGKTAAFKAAFQQAQAAGEFGPYEAIEDKVSRIPYAFRSDDTPEALSRVLIRREDDRSYEDVAERSDVVKALEKGSFYRVYVANDSVRDRVAALAGAV